MANNQIPRATALRLPIYHRYLRYLQNTGKKRISSTELSEAVKIDSATIRRDFSYFGALGKRGYGYDVDNLIDFFSKVLNQDRVTKICLVGVGHLGQALLNYNFRKNANIYIEAAFDTNPDVIGREFNGIRVHDTNELADKIKEMKIEIAVLAVPEEAAEQTVDVLVTAGIRGILNFTPLRFDVPNNVRVQNVDLTNELQTLIYFIDSNMDLMDDYQEFK